MSELPMQPLVVDPHGVVRFRANALVRYLLDAGPFDMNHLAAVPCDQETREQFAQLIGYSVSGYGDLSYVSKESVERADAAVEALADETSRQVGEAISNLEV